MKGKENATLYFYIFAAIITALLFFIPLSSNSEPTEQAFSPQWYSDTSLQTEVNPNKPEFNDNLSVSLYTMTPEEIKTGYSLWGRAKNSFVSILIDGEVRYKSPAENKVYGKSPGTYWIDVPLGEKDGNKLIEIQIVSAYPDGSCYLDELAIGDRLHLFKNAVIERAVGSVTCLFLMVVGICLVIAHIALFKTKIDTKELLFLGLFAFSTALWSFSESKVVQLFWSNSGKMHNLSCMSLMLIVLPLFMYFKSDLDKKNKHLVSIISWVSITNFSVATALHFCGVLDFHETLTLTHITLTIGALGVIYANYLRYFSSHKKSLTNIFSEFAMISIGAAAIIDIVRYRSGAVNDSSLFTRIGLSLYVIALAIDSLTYVANMVQKGLKTDLISRLAYEDGLTGLGNRTAYQEYLAEVSSIPLTIFMFDINFLKQVNDKMGHESGDSLIITSANLINTVFSNVGKCFRIGGDEFIVIVKGRIDAPEILNVFQKYIDTINQSQAHQFIINIAVGYSFYGGNGHIERAIGIADKFMYRKKSMLKAQCPEIFKNIGSVTTNN